jgi:hypothetical protein
VWYWLALAGAAGLLAEFLLYGRFSRGGERAGAPVLKMRRKRGKVGASS